MSAASSHRYRPYFIDPFPLCSPFLPYPRNRAPATTSRPGCPLGRNSRCSSATRAPRKAAATCPGAPHCIMHHASSRLALFPLRLRLPPDDLSSSAAAAELFPSRIPTPAPQARRVPRRSGPEAASAARLLVPARGGPQGRPRGAKFFSLHLFDPAVICRLSLSPRALTCPSRFLQLTRRLSVLLVYRRARICRVPENTTLPRSRRKRRKK